MSLRFALATCLLVACGGAEPDYSPPTEPRAMAIELLEIGMARHRR